MCDSGFSEVCSADFTNYCRAGSLCDEDIGRQCRLPNYRRMKSSKVRSRVAWFTRKSNLTTPHRRSNVLTQVRIRPLGETYNDPLDVSTKHSDFSSSSDEELPCVNNELPNNYVSQEELEALKGCVTKRRALFSPNFLGPSGSCSSSHTIPKQRSKREAHHSLRQTVPSERSFINSDSEDQLFMSKVGQRHYHPRQGSLEYDHLENYYPGSQSRSSAVPDSVSIQFRANSYECVAEELNVVDGGAQTDQFKFVKGEASLSADDNPYMVGKRSYSFDSRPLGSKVNSEICSSCSIPGRLNSPNLRQHLSPRLQRRHRPSSGSPRLHTSPAHNVKDMCPPSHARRGYLDHAICNSWPRNRVYPELDNTLFSNQDEYPGERSKVVKTLHRPPVCAQQGCESWSPLQVRSSEYNSTSVDVVPNSRYGLCDLGSTTSMCSIQSHNSAATNVSSSFDRPHCSYVKGVTGVDFKDKSEKMVSWFSQFNDQQRNMLLLKLLEQSDCAQMHFLSIHMEPILHAGCPHNCQDLLSWLPFYITEHILTFLDPVSLCQASQVSHSWYQITSQSKLWMTLCKLSKWQLSAYGETSLLNLYTSMDGTVQWKSLFAEKFRLKRNWLKGYCTVRTFEGHTQGISCIQFDDTRIVSGSWDKTIKVWNRRTNTVWAALTLAGHSGTVRCLHLHENRLVSGSSDRTIKVWDLSTDKIGWVGAACRATMVGHMHTVRCLQADDTKVISGSYDLTLKVWNIKTGQCKRTLRGHTDAVLCLQFDDEDVVSGSKDMTIKVWSLSSGMCKLTLHGHQAAVTCVQFDKTKIISGALDTLIKIWNITNGECIRTIDWIRSEGHTGVIRHLQADSWKIVSAADDKTMKVWSVHTGDRLLTLKSHTDGVTCLQFNDKVIVSGSYDKTVKLWDFSAC